MVVNGWKRTDEVAIGVSSAQVGTLREDRLDNFWYTLMHECVHAWKHLNIENRRVIADRNIEKPDDDEVLEREANE
jgi:hypothetical protein